eukprot:Opistho-2@62680
MNTAKQCSSQHNGSRSKCLKFGEGRHPVGLGQLWDSLCQQLRHLGRIGRHRGEHGGDGNGLVGFPPAVIVGCHGNCSIAEARLLCKHNLRNSGHVDDIATPRAKHVALGSAAEARALDCYHGTPLVVWQTKALADINNDATRVRAKGIAHRNVANTLGTCAGAVIKGAVALCSPVNELVKNDKLSRRYFLSQRSACRGDNEVRASLTLQRVNVGAVVDVGGTDVVFAPVAREQYAVNAPDVAADQRIGGLAIRCIHVLFRSIFKQFRVVQSRATNDANLYHGRHFSNQFSLFWLLRAIKEIHNIQFPCTLR